VSFLALGDTIGDTILRLKRRKIDQKITQIHTAKCQRSAGYGGLWQTMDRNICPPTWPPATVYFHQLAASAARHLLPR
jgi:hypothetical protein